MCSLVISCYSYGIGKYGNRLQITKFQVLKSMSCYKSSVLTSLVIDVTCMVCKNLTSYISYDYTY